MGSSASVRAKNFSTKYEADFLAANTDEEKLKLFNDLQEKLLQAKKHEGARKLQAMHRGKSVRCIAKKGDDLRVVFAKYANFGKSKNQRGNGDAIDSTRFRKMLKDSHLIHKKKLSNTACDMIHVKCKTKGEKLLTFVEFLEKAIPEIAQKHGMEEGEVAQRICEGGPTTNATKAEYNKFYDDKATWTGVATRGGPSTNDNRLTLSKMMDRSAADVRGIGKNAGQ